MFKTIDIIGSGMTANKQWLELTANNITNMNTTRTEKGGPYHRQTLQLEAKNSFDDLFDKQVGDGVKVSKVVTDKTEDLVYDPQNVDANEEGYVRFPAINLAAEMTDMMQAQRSYEANVTTLNATKEVMKKEMEIGKV